jgi:hypothetical protein
MAVPVILTWSIVGKVSVQVRLEVPVPFAESVTEVAVRAEQTVVALSDSVTVPAKF